MAYNAENVAGIVSMISNDTTEQGTRVTSTCNDIPCDCNCDCYDPGPAGDEGWE